MSDGAFLRPTRREFLWWSAALGAGASLPIRWMGEQPVRLGFVGLGTRGRRTLSACASLPGAMIQALCDRREKALRSAISLEGAAAGLVTREARRVFANSGIDAVVLAASPGEQLDLAASAFRSGKDVFLLRPAPLHLATARHLAAEAVRSGRQIQVARATGFAVEPGVAGGLVAAGDGDLAGMEVWARFQTPERPDAGALVAELLDELDFARVLLGGKMERVVQVGGRGILPGCWIDQRLQCELVDEQGRRRWLGISLLAVRGPEAKESRILLRGSRGAAGLAGSPLPAGDPLDLGAFLEAVRTQGDAGGLSLSRAVELLELASVECLPNGGLA